MLTIAHPQTNVFVLALSAINFQQKALKASSWLIADR
jgi:hypothetical protein